MAEACYSLEQLAELAVLAADDPRLAHLQACPRCRALLASYQNFMAPGPLPGAARAAAAERELTTVLEREILGPEKGGVAGIEPRSGLAQRILDLLTLPRLRPVLAVAAALLLILGLPKVIDQHHGEAPQPVLRGQAPAEEGVVLSAEAVLQADGSVRFSWRPTSSADLYRLEFYTADLAELAHIATRSDSVFVLSAGILPGVADISAIAYWRLGALSRGDVTVRSPLQAFPATSPLEAP
jgi:hypothetical protein